MTATASLLDIIACPACKGKLRYDKKNQRFICNFHKITFPIENGVPIMLMEKAIPLKEHEDGKNKI